jgi:hypothetical protein
MTIAEISSPCIPPPLILREPHIPLPSFFRLIAPLFDKKEPTLEQRAVRITERGALELKPLSHAKLSRIARLLQGRPRPLREEKELNWRTWETFKRSLIEGVGKERFAWISKRYKHVLPLAALERGSPLLAYHIHLFYVGLSQYTVDWVDRCSGRGLKTLSTAEVTARLAQLHQTLTGGDLATPLPLLERSSTALLGLGAVYQDERKALGHLWSRLPRFQGAFLPWLEEFCKDTVNRELLAHQLIPVPGKEGSVDWYEVHARVLAKGLLAYGLRPLCHDSSLKPLIVFRPTQREMGAEGALATFQNDVELKIGSSGWLAARTAFDQLMSDPQFRRDGEQVSVAGYSIGGAHLQYFLYQFSSQVREAFSFNAPSIDAETAESFARQVNEEGHDPLTIQILRTLGDPVPKFGEKHLGDGVLPGQGVEVALTEVDIANPRIRWTQRHSARVFADPSCTTCQIAHPETQLNNVQQGLDEYQQLHRKWGWLAFHFFQLLDRIVYFLRIFTGSPLYSPALCYRWA